MRKLTTTALILAIAGLVMASEEDDLTSLSYISYLERYATVQPASQQESIEAVANMPLVPGDRVDTAREARLELFLADGNTVWLDEYTTLSLDAVAFSRSSPVERTVLYLAEGTVMVEISERSLSQQAIRVDGQAATVYLNETGLYRIEALPSGGLRLEVWQGLGEASTSAGGVLVRAESAAEVGGGQLSGVENRLSWGDEFGTWVEQRRQVVEGETSLYVDARYSRQAAQLDNYGSWVYLDNVNSWAWQPSVAADWRPYTAGRWYWTPAGWSWISYEPWGWLPHHYGSWHLSVGFGWVWSWHPYWSPAWVRWCWWPGYVGWSPWGYYDYWYWPRYHHYYGYNNWHHYGHGGSGGHGGSSGVPRRDVVPRPSSDGAQPADGSQRATGRASVARSGQSDPSLDLRGRVRVASMDRTGWNVVEDRDFASPHLPRVVQRGDVALRDRGDQMGVVMSEPLATSPPSRARTSSELERVFRQVEERSPRDLSPVMARSDELRPEDAMRLVEPTTLADASRRTGASSDSTHRTLTTTSQSPMFSSSRAGTANRYRSLQGSPDTGAAQRSPSDYRNPFVSRSRPTGSADPAQIRSRSSGRSTGLVQRPSSGVRSPTTRSPTTRSPAPTARGSSGSQPVIVPRTSASRPSRQVGSAGSAARAPSSAPPPRSSTGRSSPRSAPRSSSPPRSSSSSSRSPSSGRSSSPSAAPRSSSGSSSSRSSSGASSSRSGGSRRN